MNRYKILPNFMISFILMLILVLTEVSFMTSATLLNPDFYDKSLTKAGYYHELKLEIEKGFSNFGLASGLPQSVFQDSIDENWLKNETKHAIENSVGFLTLKEPLGYVPDTQPVLVKLRQNIIDYGREIGVSVPPESLVQMDKMLMTIANKHLNFVSSNSTLLMNLQKLTAPIYLYRFLLLVLLVLMLLVLYLINRNEIKDFLTWLSYSFTAAGVFLMIPVGLIYNSSILKRLAISNGYLRDALSGLLSDYLNSVLVVGVITVFVGILLHRSNYDFRDSP